MNNNLCTDNTINYYFIGSEEDIKKEQIFKYFDTNYIPLNNILISYYTTINPNNNNDDLNKMINKMNDNKKIYNTYNIYPLFISIIIIIILILSILLRFIFLTYNEKYSYILIFIILVIIIIGSIWFLYINNETL